MESHSAVIKSQSQPKSKTQTSNNRNLRDAQSVSPLIVVYVYIYIYGGFYFALVVEIINMFRGHVGVIDLPPWVTNEGMHKIVKFVPAFPHHQKLIGI